MGLRLSNECVWCSAPFDRSVSGIGEFCTVPCIEEAAEAVETAWSGEAA
jgi:hypothetical protein